MYLIIAITDTVCRYAFISSGVTVPPVDPVVFNAEHTHTPPVRQPMPQRVYCVHRDRNRGMEQCHDLSKVMQQVSG